MNPSVLSMAMVRFISSMLELSAALLFLYFKTPDKALRINSMLGLVGPLIFMLTSFIGLSGMAGQISTSRLIIILTGILLVLIGTASKG